MPPRNDQERAANRQWDELDALCLQTGQEHLWEEFWTEELKDAQ